MSKCFNAIALALLLLVPGTVLAASVTVSGSGTSYQYDEAFRIANENAIAKCAALGGAPEYEVYSHVSRSSVWSASVVLSCKVP